MKITEIKIDGLEIHVPEGEVFEEIVSRKFFYGIFNGKDCVIRIFPGEKFRFVYNNELNVLKHLNTDQSFQPQVYYNDDVNQVLVLEKVEGVPAGKVFYFDEKFIQAVEPVRIADLLFKMKRIKIDLPDESKELENFFQMKLENMRKVLAGYSNLVKKFERVFEKNISPKILKQGYLSHGDLNPGNIIHSKSSLKLIDWELAKNDAYWRDFACVYYLSLDYPEWGRIFFEHIRTSDMFKEDEFNFYLLFSLLGDAATFKSMIESGSSVHYRSGKIEEKELARLFERNIALANDLNFDGNNQICN